METLTCYIDDEPEFNTKEIIDIFPNISTSNIYIQNTCDLISFINIFRYSNVESLQIIDEKDDYSKSEMNRNILLKNIKYLKLTGNYDLFFDIVFKTQFPNLINYEFNFIFEDYSKVKNILDIKIKDLKDNDFNKVNKFIIETLKKKFMFQSFFELSNNLKTLKYFHLNLEIFSFIYEEKKGKKNYFEFKIKKENVFKNYYSKYNLLIDENEIIKYKKINIKGINKLYQTIYLKENKDFYSMNEIFNPIEEIIEDKNINLNVLNLSLNIKRYIVKSLKDLKSIYCEDEIQKLNFFKIRKIKDIIDNNGFQNLKNLNLTIGYIKEENNNISKDLSKFFQNLKNLKCLKLRLSSHNLSFFIPLILNLKKLKLLEIKEINNNNNISLKSLIYKYPNLKERQYFFKEFKLFENKKNNIKCEYDIKTVGETKLLDNMKEYIENFEIYIDDEKFEFEQNFNHFFNKLGKYSVKIDCKKVLTTLFRLFIDCENLTSIEC